MAKVARSEGNDGGRIQVGLGERGILQLILIFLVVDLYMRKDYLISRNSEFINQYSCHLRGYDDSWNQRINKMVEGSIILRFP